MFLPPFHAVEHRFDHLPFEEGRPPRRGAPARLRFGFPGPGLPVIVLAPGPGPEPRPEPRPVRAPSGLRLRVGLLLIAWGRRLAEA